MNKFITDFIEGFKMAIPGFNTENPLGLGSFGRWTGKKMFPEGGKLNKFAEKHPIKTGLMGTGLAALAVGLGATNADYIAQGLSANNLENGVIPFRELAAEQLALQNKRENGLFNATFDDVTQEDINNFNSLMSDKTDLTEDYSWVSGLGGQPGEGYNAAWDRFMGNPAKATNYKIGKKLYFNHANDGWMDRGYKPIIGANGSGALITADGSRKDAVRAMQDYLDAVDLLIWRGENYPAYTFQSDFIKDFANSDGNVSLEGRRKAYNFLENILLEKAKWDAIRKAAAKPKSVSSLNIDSPEVEAQKLQDIRDL